MHVYKTRLFDKWAEKEGINDAILISAVAEIERGLIDADLGGAKAVGPVPCWPGPWVIGPFSCMALPKTSVTISTTKNSKR